MIDDKEIVIESSEEAKEIVEKRADAYEHIVQKASSLLQLIIGSLSVIAALTAAGLITEFTGTLFEPDGVDEVTTLEAITNITSSFFLFSILIMGLVGMFSHLIGILTKNDYPGVVSSNEVISSQVGSESDIRSGDNESGEDDGNDESGDDESDYIQYSTWLINYACGETDDESPLNNVQQDYRTSVVFGMISMFSLFSSVLLLSYLFNGARVGVLFINLMIILVTVAFLFYYHTSDEFWFMKQNLSGIPIYFIIALAVGVILLSVVSIFVSVIELSTSY